MHWKYIRGKRRFIWKRVDMIPLDVTTDLAACVKTFIHQVWKSRDVNMFPGPHPVSIERKHIPLLTQTPYVVCEKTDGTRFFLVCIRHNDKKYAVFVNRAMNMYIVQATMPPNTIVDGELIEKNFMIYDGIIINNEYIGDLNFIERLKKTEMITKGPVIQGGIRLKMKTMWKISQLSELSKKKFEYETDGFIFTPVNDPIRMETHETMFKWKPLERITMDFMMKEYKMYVWDRRHGGYIFIQNFPQNSHMYKDDHIIECKFKNNEWIPLKIRQDKCYPNNRRTYIRTMVNIQENIKIDELCQL